MDWNNPSSDPTANSGFVVRLLAIEDEDPVAQRIGEVAARLRMSFRRAATGAEGVRIAMQWRPQLITLDLHLHDMPGAGGLTVCRTLRSQLHETKIVVFTTDSEHAPAAFACGASGFIKKTDTDALQKLRAYLRSLGQWTLNTAYRRDIEIGDLHIDAMRQIVTVTGQPVALTPKQYQVLALLAEHAGSVVTYDTILKQCWGESYVDPAGRASLREFVGALRRTIEPNPASPRYVQSHIGVGYRLAIPPVPSDTDPSIPNSSHPRT